MLVPGGAGAAGAKVLGHRVPGEVVAGKRPAQADQRGREPRAGDSGAGVPPVPQQAVGSLAARGAHGRQPSLQRISELLVVRTSFNPGLNVLISESPL